MNVKEVLMLMWSNKAAMQSIIYYFNLFKPENFYIQFSYFIVKILNVHYMRRKNVTILLF